MSVVIGICVIVASDCSVLGRAAAKVRSGFGEVLKKAFVIEMRTEIAKMRRICDRSMFKGCVAEMGIECEPAGSFDQIVNSLAS